MSKRYRNRKYLEWVRTQPCVLTGMPADDAHHIIGVGKMSGMGLTAPDWTAIPVTRESHQRFHSEPELWPDQWEYIARTLGRAIEEGVL